jgi:hypothetical protein
VHDPLTVIIDVLRPWPNVRDTTPRRREEDPRYQHRQWGPFNVRASRFRCAHCDEGKVTDPPPSYHEHGGYRAGEDCPDCRGRGYNDVPLLARKPYLSMRFWRFGSKEWYFPTLITLWHVDPEVGGDDDSCARPYLNRWRDAYKDGDVLRTWFWLKMTKKHRWWHVHHWRVQVRPWQDLNRWLWTRCAGCGKRFPWGYAPVSHQWDSDGPAWRRPEVGKYHFECSNARAARQPPEVAVPRINGE